MSGGWWSTVWAHECPREKRRYACVFVRLGAFKSVRGFCAIGLNGIFVSVLTTYSSFNINNINIAMETSSIY